MRASSLLTALATAAACVAPLTGALAKDEALAKAIAAEHRSPNFVARDAARKPQEVLEFIGVKPNMAVVEISPGGGYWTEILAPYLERNLRELQKIKPALLPEERYKKFRKMGFVEKG